ncbi:response regulator transcription factor [Streptomyces sp. S3(2020)]|uniref:LuxR C-terminal-related transcriptional regulator n=1 Tax=Streptomyces sp. S3(2020) TaxID=2732044 RepID=UPI0014876DA9|nr:response regulator transcription factor [Streptomyces sp. S3(2020)]NNN32870.1 response regulator transcription factor [Streptomyces sp. S3(2020)]
MSLVRRLSPEVLITDFRLAGMSGLELATQVTGDSFGGPAPEVLMFSTRTDDVSVMQALGAGAYGYLVKETPPAEVIRAVRALAVGEAAATGMVTRRLIDWLFWRHAKPVAASQDKLGTLTPREREALLLVAAGLSDEEISRKLTLQVTTVRSHLYHLRQKLGVRDRAQLIVFAYQSGFSVPTAPLQPQ